jgi:hypothetical protein
MTGVVFIGSASNDEAKSVVAEITSNLIAWGMTPKPWYNSFRPGHVTILELQELARETDFGVFVLTPDDTVVDENGARILAPRDNVILEVGIFVGALGLERTFLVRADGPALKWATDLLGVGEVRYHLAANVTIPAALLGPLENTLKPAMQLGPIQDRLTTSHIYYLELRNLVAATQKADFRHNRYFLDAARTLLGDVQRRATDWAGGSILIPWDYYWHMLKGLYAAAKKEIFTTSAGSYDQAWSTPEGNQLFATQVANTIAQSTRVFVFRDQSQVTTEIRELMDQQAKRIDVRVVFENQVNNLFPKNIGSDWAVIDDGAVVAITKSFDRYEAEFRCPSDADAKAFCQLRDKVRQASSPL